MKKSRIVWPVAAVALLLMLGLLTGLAAGADGTGDPPSTTSATSAPATSTAPTTSTDPGTTTTTTDPGTTTTTTDPGTTTTTTDPGTTTTDPGTTTTDPGTTTAPSTTTTTDPGTTTTTGPVVTAANTLPTTTDSTTQSNSTPASSPQATTTVAAPPTAPCDTTQITCGNNASTQVAIVSQTCVASSQNTTLNIEIKTLGGTPVNNVTISPQTSCLNTVQITQIVEQYCLGCTVIVIPPPAPVIYVPVPGTNTVTTVTTVETPATPPVRVQAYCMPKPVLRPDGSTGNLLYLPLGEPQRDPRYGAAVPATFVPGVGMKCPSAIGTTVSTRVPVFTLTVPASFVGQFVRLCLQPASTRAKPLCHSIRIDLGATIAVPVTSNVIASVVKTRGKTTKPKSKVQISQTAKAFSSALTPPGKGKASTATTNDTTRKGA